MKGWKRVDARNPCGVCGKTSWCGVAPDGTLLCMRSTTPPIGYVIVPHKKSGTLFRPKEDSRMSKYKVSPANERQYLGRTFGSKAEMEYCKIARGLCQDWLDHGLHLPAPCLARRT